MTSQTLTYSSLSNQPMSVASATQPPLTTKIDPTQIKQVRQSYQAIQQLKFLHLQAEIDVLLQELQTLKHHKETATLNPEN